MPQNDITKRLEEIARTEICDSFGQPFIKIFKNTYNGKREEILAAAYTCSLFLSCLLYKMPTEILHTFVYYTKERFCRFSFNCNMYETLFSKMEINDLQDVHLLNGKQESVTCTLTRKEIFEAFDFYTNR